MEVVTDLIHCRNVSFNCNNRISVIIVTIYSFLFMQLFPCGQTKSWDYAKLPENRTKNRYGELLPCEYIVHIVINITIGCFCKNRIIYKV